MTQIDADSQLIALASIYYAAGDGNAKPPSYMSEYERLLGHRRDAPLRLLEIGVASGASLRIWRDYLPNATIVGIDVAEPPASIAGQSRIHFIQGSQDDPEILERAAALAGGPFDLIIDDASHIGYLTKRSFEYLFPRWLLPGGNYVIEDLGTAFLEGYPDGAPFVAPSEHDMTPEAMVFASHQHGMVGVVKQLFDHMMTELITGQQPRLEIERVTLMTNIAFVKKAGGSPLQAAGNAPGNAAEAAPVSLLSALAATLRQQDLRLSAVEQGLRALVEQLRQKPGLRHRCTLLLSRLRRQTNKHR